MFVCVQRQIQLKILGDLGNLFKSIWLEKSLSESFVCIGNFKQCLDGSMSYVGRIFGF